MKNLSKIFGFTFLILGIGFAVFLFFQSKSKNENEKKFIAEAKVSFLKGTAQISEIANWSTAETKTRLKNSQTLKTSENSLVILEFPDGTEVRLSENTEVKINLIDKSKYDITLLYGEIFNRVFKNNARSFIISDDEYIVSSLGTAFSVKKDKTKKEFKVSVLENKVEIKERVNVENKQIVESGKVFVAGNEAKVREMSEEERKSEFNLWNRERDLKKYKNELGVLNDIYEPYIDILEPKNESIFNQKEIAIRGSSEATAKIFVGGVEVKNINGNFETKWTLDRFTQTIEIKAIDENGNSSKKYVTAKRNIEIYTSSYQVSNGIKVSWTYDGISDKGFKVVWGLSENPTFPNNENFYASDSNFREYIIPKKDGKTYHIRVCVYNNGECINYSNDSVAIAPKPVETPATCTGICISKSGTAVSWSTSLESPYGFKVVWSKNSGPTYPTRSGDKYFYYSDSNTRKSENLIAFDGDGTYYVRVCEYLGGKCGTYSNQISINLTN